MVGRFRTYKDSVYDFVPSPLYAMGIAGGLPIPLTTTLLVYNLYCRYTTEIINFWQSFRFAM